MEGPWEGLTIRMYLSFGRDHLESSANNQSKKAMLHCARVTSRQHDGTLPRTTTKHGSEHHLTPYKSVD
jgi:hypothetical protein